MASLSPKARIGLVTDSNAQLTAALVERLGVEVVPIAIVVDGESHQETELDTDDFYDRLANGATVSTSQPSPGEFAKAYSALADSGVEGIVSVHVGSNLSGTVNSARLGAELVSLPVEIIDTGQTSFSVGLAVWSAADAIAAGLGLDGAAAAARRTCDEVTNVFVIEALTLARRSGRVSVNDSSDAADNEAAIPVVTLRGTDLDVAGHADDVEAACEIMANGVASEPGPVRVGIGVGGRQAFDFYDELAVRLAELDNIDEVVKYRCGPSVGAFSGPAIAGLAWAPVLDRPDG